MITCITGPDFAGKSTLISQLSRAHDFFMHNGTYAGMKPDELFDVYSSQIDEAVKTEARGFNIWIDRSPVDEAIYGPVFRGGSRLTEEQVLWLDTKMDAAGVIKVFMDTPDELLIERFRGDRGDDLVAKEEQLLLIASEYRRVMRHLKNWIVWTPQHSELIKDDA